jgi:ribose 5-phosphate isomerase RpiB
MGLGLSTARKAREQNDAIVLTLGATLIRRKSERGIGKIFLSTPFAGG